MTCICMICYTAVKVPRASGTKERGQDKMSKRIGFIGLGNMGRGMCRNLIRAGHTLTVLDTS